MNDWTITGGQLLWILGAIGTAAVAWKYISAPFKQLDAHEREIAALKAAVDQIGENQKTTLSTLMAMVNHMIDGNGIDGLRKVRNDLQKELIDK